MPCTSQIFADRLISWRGCGSPSLITCLNASCDSPRLVDWAELYLMLHFSLVALWVGFPLTPLRWIFDPIDVMNLQGAEDLYIVVYDFNLLDEAGNEGAFLLALWKPRLCYSSRLRQHAI